VTALELRIIAYALLALVLLGGSAWVGHRLTAIHYESLLAAEKAAQAAALQDAQRNTIAAQQAQAEALQQAEKQYADLKVDYDSLGGRLADSVRQYAALRSVILSQAGNAAPKPDAVPQGASGDSRLATLSGHAATACLEDAAELTALQSWARAVSELQ
jgi:hypothetical protein